MMQNFYLLSLLTLLSACGYSARGINQEPPQRYVHKYGVDVTQEDWERRGRYGDVITTTTAGVTIRKRFSHGIQDGETTYSFPHRQEVAKSEMWKEGQLQSEFMLYPTGEKEREILY